MSASTHMLTLPGAMIHRGFWLYVWRIASPIGELLYVGRTGDSASVNAAAPFARMGQHLSTNPNQNMVRKNLVKECGVQPEDCDSFVLIAYGPLCPEAQDWDTHVKRRDVVWALEKNLAEELGAAGYKVINTVKGHRHLNEELWAEVRGAFAAHFRRLVK